MTRLFFWGVAIAMSSAASTPTLAYIGPGAGVGAIGTALAVIAAALLLVLGFVWYPIKRLLRARKANTKNVTDTSQNSEKKSTASVTAEKGAKSKY